MSKNKTFQEKPTKRQFADYDEFVEVYTDFPDPEPIEVLNLVMRKTVAQAIIEGKKKVEFRSYTADYVRRLYDKTTEDWFERHKDELDFENLFDIGIDSMRPVNVLHFHGGNQNVTPWSLDVECTLNDTNWVDDECIEMLHRDYDAHDLDEMNRKLNREGATNRPMFFYFELGKILARNNI